MILIAKDLLINSSISKSWHIDTPALHPTHKHSGVIFQPKHADFGLFKPGKMWMGKFYSLILELSHKLLGGMYGFINKS